MDQPPIRFELRRGAVTAIPLAIAVGLFGVSFGVLSATSGGMGALPAVVMSITTFAGSAQFAARSRRVGRSWDAACGPFAPRCVPSTPPPREVAQAPSGGRARRRLNSGDGEVRIHGRGG